MNAAVIIFLVLAFTLCLMPCALAWYFNFGGLLHYFRNRKRIPEHKPVHARKTV